MNIRRISGVCLFTVLCLCGLFGASAQSVDERIGKAMNEGDWFALDSIYSSTPKDSIHPFLEVFSRCLLGNRFNRPDVSIPAFAELLNNHSESLGLENLLNSAVMFSMDLSMEGDNAKAAGVIESVLGATKQYLDSAAVASMRRYGDKYKALAAYNPYNIKFDGETGRVPFRIVPVGKPEKKAVLMHLSDTKINGVDADVTFDTGAGVNIVSHELAAKYNLIPLDATNTVAGVGRRDGSYVIAKELAIGNITVSDVPFLVMDISSNNAEADQYIDAFNIIVGSELMLRLKDVTIDFEKKEIIVPAEAPMRSGVRPNMYFSTQMNLLTKGSVLGNPMLMVIDSGDASYGMLSRRFYDTNESYVKAHAEPDSIRMAGIAGVVISPCYKVPDMPLSMGGNVVLPNEMAVLTGEWHGMNDYECTVGLKTLMLFGKVRFNLVDLVVSTEKSSCAFSAMPNMKAPASLKVTKEKNPNALQTLGFIAVGLGRSLINPNAPSMPDL